MFDKTLGPRKRLNAYIASERPFSSVDALVTVEVALNGEEGVALATRKLFLVGVAPLTMNSQRRFSFERFIAFVASEFWLIIDVSMKRCLMNVEDAQLGEAPFTDVTFERSFSGMTSAMRY